MENRREISADCLGGLYSVHGAAKRLGLTYECLRSRIRRDDILVVRIGHECFVRLSDITARSPGRCLGGTRSR